MYWLGQQFEIVSVCASLDQEVIGFSHAREQQDFAIGVMLPELNRKVDACHSGHHDIRNQQLGL